MNKKLSNLNLRKKDTFTLFLIIFFSVLIDKIFHANTLYLPGWDQGYHLTNLFRTYNIFANINFSSFDWWDNLWKISDTYRGPLTYIISSFFLLIFGKNYENSLISNNIFSIITIFCIFKMAKEIRNNKAGLWGALIFAFNPYIFDQRVDYLIDLSQVCFINLNFFILFKFIKTKGGFLLSFLLGTTLGLVFLTKPTGLLFLVLPYIVALYYYLKNSQFKKNTLIDIVTFITSFLITIWPWLSINWLTILTSIFNSWQWGIKYQDGLEANTLEGIIFYPIEIFNLVGPYILGSFSVIGFIEYFKNSKEEKFSVRRLNNFSKKYIFLLSLPINILIVCTLMSTKDLRFILPILPCLCIFSGLFISSLRKYSWIKYYKIILLIIIISTSVLHLFNQINIYKNLEKKSIIYWPHKEIIEKVNSLSTNLKSVVAVLPDTREFNTFNIAAEAELQDTNIAIVQVMSNEKTYKEDINRFSWFVLKDGDQGTMTNNAKQKLAKLIKESNRFENFKSWSLPDGSKASLYKRKRMNESVSLISNKNPLTTLDLFFKGNGLTINLKGNEKILNNSNLLIDVKNKKETYEINVALPKISNYANRNIEIIKNINLDNPINFNDTLNFNALILSKQNQDFAISSNQSTYEENINPSFEINTINELDKMGKFLKNGDFDKLFNLVELVNQSDPSQKYLKDSEQIFKYRYKVNKKNIDYLYNIAISQILQRKSNEAASTLKELIKLEKNNSNLYLAKAVIDIYNFNPREAEKNITLASKFNNNKKLYSTINTIQLISKIINFRIISLINV
ncbi:MULTISPECIES: glycosyltransferase family 39 protein [unclassified Prochlorococcus]|uniref:glycosyltransferase family 39 protein n=1 Tax=unclassified Prochlorococcus TaxID=2627481 RepID=UPI00097CC321|nr:MULTISPECIES: glycosyltransferase family 39 protein [unclassified Prochlorococcus]AQL29772.1 hypothetical protein BSR22_00625 [Prochlorococcus sp. RS50]AQL31597.1 hypothetical protein BS620_00850 [Prochlorococcus sp. RS01]AQL34549.1 hypothetical protein BS621_07170 [Prochlorococcus sp. RS04]